ncbi:MAG TPA: transporter substrate-binding domain-containing protein [Alphaproteobacteria bacterium]|nr:transporter substrate-binding domain-containing protein [Alphaproteobacteria bacterium]
MRRLAALGLAVALAFGLGRSGPALAEAPKTLRIAYADTETFPNQMGTLTVPAERPGVAVELVRMTLADLGLGIELVRVPNKRVLDGLREGAFDAAFSFSYSAERAEFARYPMKDGRPDAARRLNTLTYAIYRARGGALDWDGQAFRNLDRPLGANAGFSVAADLRKLGLPVEEAPTTDQNFRKLLSGRIAGFAMQDIVAEGYLASAPAVAAGVEQLPRPFAQKDYFLLLSHPFAAANPALAERIWTRLGELRAAHQAALLEKYVGGEG